MAAGATSLRLDGSGYGNGGAGDKLRSEVFFGVLIDPLIEEYGWSRGAISLVYSLQFFPQRPPAGNEPGSLWGSGC